LNLREFQAKKIIAEHGINVPAGVTTADPEDVLKIAYKLRPPVVLKPQLGLKKRGKLGIISFCDDAAMAEQEAVRLFGLTVSGEHIKTLLVEKKVEIVQELYVAIAVDYSRRCPVMMVSQEGGVDIEDLSRNEPEKILKLPINILKGPTEDDLATIAEFTDEEVAQQSSSLYSIFRTYDAEIVETNPLVRTKDGDLVAVDAVLNVNDSALYRQPDVAKYHDEIAQADALVEEATANKWTYIDLPGDIAILSSGAGLTMTILDLIQLAGGSAANFLDTAQIDEKGIYRAFEFLAKAKDARAMIVNIFAGLNRCDLLAQGIVQYLSEHSYHESIVIRMIGNKEETGHAILKRAGIEPYTNLEEAVERVVFLSKQS
jgi:succinyl-CoA synthetase beta subunit